MDSSLTKISDYDVLACLSEHEHACVLQVKKHDCVHTFALKLARTPIGAARLKNEVSLLSKLQASSHLISCIDSGVYTHCADTEPMPFFVSAYFPLSIQALLLSTDFLLHREQIAQIARQLGSALNDLHELGVLHTDVHPNNILCSNITDSASPVHVVLIDLASAFEQNSVSFELARETTYASQQYASPEQLDGLVKPQIQSDIYSASAVLLALITQQPFDRNRPIDSLDNKLTAGLKEFFLKALNTDPKSRYSSIPDWLNAFTGVLAQANESFATPLTNTNVAANASDEASAKANSRHEEVITEALEPLAKINQPLNMLKQSLVDMLLLDGYISVDDEQDLAKRFDMQGSISSPELVIAALKDEALEHVRSTLNEGAFLDWVSEVLRYQQRYLGPSYPPTRKRSLTGLSHREYQQFISRGLAQNAGDEERLHQWLKRHFVLPRSNAQKITRALAVVFIVIVLVFITKSYFTSVNDASDEISDVTSDAESDDTSEETFTISTQSPENSSEVIDVTKTEKITEKNTEKNTNNNTAASTESITTIEALEQANFSKNEGLASKTPVIEDSSANLQKPSGEVLAVNRSKIYQLVNEKSNTLHTMRFEHVAVMPAQNAEGDAYNLYVMNTEVTQALWQACVDAGQCRYKKSISTNEARKRLYKPNHPVVGVSWFDISEDFIAFVNNALNASFALPTMAEWMTYGFNSNGEPAYPKAMHCKDCANGSTIGVTNTDQILSMQPAQSTLPVKSLSLSDKGLYHVYGNAQEWLQDCWQDVRLRLERCDQAAAVGGSWQSSKRDILQQPYVRLLKTARSTSTGFRLVQRESID